MRDVSANCEQVSLEKKGLLAYREGQMGNGKIWPGGLLQDNVSKVILSEGRDTQTGTWLHRVSKSEIVRISQREIVPGNGFPIPEPARAGYAFGLQ